MKQSFCLVTTLVLLTWAPVCFAQKDAVASAAPASFKKNVYVVEFGQSGSSFSFPQLGAFATSFLQLRLNQLEGVSVLRQTNLPECPRSLSSLERTGKQEQVLSSASDLSLHYVVHGSIEIRTADFGSGTKQGAASKELVLDYELLKIASCQSVSVFRSSETFNDHDTLRTLAVVGNLLADRLTEDLTHRVQIFIKPSQSVADDPVSQAFYEGLVDTIIGDLASGNEFQAYDIRSGNADSATEYTLEVQLSFTRTLNPLKRFAISGVEANFLVTPTASAENQHHYSINKAALKGSLSDRENFYRLATDTIANGLHRILVAKEANLTEELGSLETDAALARARMLLCINAEDTCQARPEAALLALTSVQRPTGDSLLEFLTLMGRGQYLSAQYRKAAQTFDDALSLESSKSASQVVELVNQAGDAWYKAQDYVQAIQRYERSLAVSAQNTPSLPDNLRIQPEIHLQRARSLRFSGKRLEALDSLLASAAVLPKPDPINIELQGLLIGLSRDELGAATARLEACGDKRLAPSLVVAYTRTAIFDLQESRFDSVDTELTKAETLISKSTPKFTRVQLLSLRASWYELAKADFAKAVEVSQGWIKLDDSRQAEYRHARYRYLEAHAKSLDKTARRKAYEEVVDWITPLVKERFPGADELLYLSNHALGHDQETRALIEEIVAQKPSDQGALLTVMYVCTEYLQDFECALKNAEMYEKSQPGGASFGMALDLIEIYVLNGKYETALGRIQTIIRDPSLEPKFRTVNDFYYTWTLLALGHTDEAREAATRWKSDLVDVQVQKADLGWVFGAVPKALAQEPKLTEDQKIVLSQMVASMTDLKRPLPQMLF